MCSTQFPRQSGGSERGLTAAGFDATIHPDEAMIKSAAQPEALLGWMACLADATRLRLLRLLERHELGVVELCDVLQLPQSTVSRHLKVLSDQGWLDSSRQGTAHLYRMLLDELDMPTRRLWLLAREQTEGWATVRQDELRLSRRLKEKQDAAAVFFAGAAGRWDKLRKELYGDRFSGAAMLAVLSKEIVVADLGCGTGQVAAELAPFVGRVIGVDSSAAMLKAAQKRTGELENVELRRGDLSAIPIEDGSCDAAMLILALTYVSDPAAVLRETRRILKSGGRIVIVDLLPHDREDFKRQLGQQGMGFEVAEMKTKLEVAGFAQIDLRPIPPEEGVKGPALFMAIGGRA
jgi:ArsR family transcriptional regulator